MSTLLTEMRDVIEEVYTDLNTEGINFAGRVSVQWQSWGITATGNPYKKGTDSLIEARDLVVMDLDIGQVKQWRDGTLQIVGDGMVRISQKNFNRETLLGTNLEKDTFVRYQIGTDYYTIVNSLLTDEEGLTWKIILKREPQNNVPS